MSLFKTSLLASAAMFATHTWAAPADTTRSWRSEVSLTGRAAAVLRSGPILRGENATGRSVDAAFAGDLRYSFRMPRGTQWNRYYPHAYQGIGVGIAGFSPSELTGTPFNVYVLQGSRITSLSSRLSLDYEWNFGASFGWKKITNGQPFDYADVDGFGSNANAYINLDLLLKYRLSSRVTLTGGIGLSHFSNGNTDYPNPGVNTVWARLGVAYRLGDGTDTDSRADWSGFDPGFVYDITLYGAWRKGYYDPSVAGGYESHGLELIPGHFGVAGFNINPLYRVNPIFAAGASLDGQYDEAANLSPCHEPSSGTENPRFYRQPFGHRCSLGLSARVELAMPIFSVNIGLGHSLWAPGGKDMRGWYQTFTLKTFIGKRFYLSTGYRLLRFRDPGNLMLGAGFRFGG